MWQNSWKSSPLRNAYTRRTQTIRLLNNEVHKITAFVGLQVFCFLLVCKNANTIFRCFFLTRAHFSVSNLALSNLVWLRVCISGFRFFFVGLTMWDVQSCEIECCCWKYIQQTFLGPLLFAFVWMVFNVGNGNVLFVTTESTAPWRWRKAMFYSSNFHTLNKLDLEKS